MISLNNLNEGAMISVYIHQPVELTDEEGGVRKIPKGMAEIRLQDLDKIKDQIAGEMVTFILPIRNRNFFQKSMNQWIYQFLMMFQAQWVAIVNKAEQGEPGKDGKDGKDGQTPTTDELKTIIAPMILPPIPGTPGKDGAPGTPGKDGITPTETEITAIIQKVMPKVPVIKTKTIPLNNIALGLREQAVVWDTPFENTSYIVIPTVQSAGAIIQLESNWITDQTKTGCKIRVRNVSLSLASGTLTCTAIGGVS